MSGGAATAALPHAGQQVLATGKPLAEARLAVILLHGRGGSAPDILGLARSIGVPDAAYLAPQAAGNAWYPYRFLERTSVNEPFLSGALAAVGRTVAAVEEAGIPAERIVVAGFSQGACLATEFAVRNPKRWGGVVGLSGGLIGADDEIVVRAGDLQGTPVIFGCSDVDFHIPLERVQASTRVLTDMGADVDETIYPGMGHGINEDEILKVRALLRRVAAGQGVAG